MTFELYNCDGSSFTNSISYQFRDDGPVFAHSGAARRLTVSGPQPAPNRKTVFIADLGDARVSLSRPLPVSIEILANSATAFSPDTGDFAVGIDEISALDEFKATVVALYFLLKEENGSLGPLPRRHWNFLKSVIQES